MNMTIVPASIKKELIVNCSLERAFDTFVRRMGGWWVKAHSLSSSGQKDVIIEPFVGGRWYEIGNEGEECVWGKVLAIDPPNRLVLDWQLTSAFQYDPTFSTEVEIRFEALDAGRTRFTLEHRDLAAFGEHAAQTAAVLESENGWGGLVAQFQASAERVEVEAV